MRSAATSLTHSTEVRGRSNEVRGALAPKGLNFLKLGEDKREAEETNGSREASNDQNLARVRGGRLAREVGPVERSCRQLLLTCPLPSGFG